MSRGKLDGGDNTRCYTCDEMACDVLNQNLYLVISIIKNKYRLDGLDFK